MMTGFERYTKKIRRAMFLEEMEQVVPWGKLCGLIEPHYPKPGNGRRPNELEKMLRIYLLSTETNENEATRFKMSNVSNKEKQYDFIVVGARAAGSVVAAELSLGAQLLVMESGRPDDAPTIANPDLSWSSSNRSWT